MKVQEVVSRMVCGKKKKICFSGGKKSKGQIYTIAASCLLYLAEDHDVWDPQKQRAFGIVGIGAKIFFFFCEAPLLSSSVSQSTGNKGTKCLKSLETQERFKTG